MNYYFKMSLSKIISISEEVLGGTPVFFGTRVPVISLFEHLQNGISLKEFLEDFPSVKKKQAIAILEFSLSNILSISNSSNFNKNENPSRRKSA